MTPADAARVLAVAALYDRRTVGEADAVAWADALNGLAPRECAEAVRAHYTESTDWVMPAHIRRRVAARRRDDAQSRKDTETLKGIAAATAQHEHERSHANYLETRAAFDAAIKAARAARGEVEDDLEASS